MTIASVARAAAFTGSTVMAAGSIVAALAYTGVDGEAYSPLNHWVSELGEIGVSELAPVFNAAVVASGVGFAVFMAGLALTGAGAPRFGYGPIGVVAGVAGALVGVFPMHEPARHAIVALLFFGLGWIAVALASIPVATGGDRRFPRWLAGVGALTVAASLAFLALLGIDPLVGGSSLDAPIVRPDVWPAALFEWLVIGGIIAWTFLAAMTWRSAARVVVPPWEVRS